jgi:hypothetical protein
VIGGGRFRGKEAPIASCWMPRAGFRVATGAVVAGVGEVSVPVCGRETKA